MGNLHYFGTDGIRGPYGNAPISEDFMQSLASAMISYLEVTRGPELKRSIVIGRDTRSSGPALSDAFTQAFIDAGYTVYDCSIASTPIIAFQVKELAVDLGVAITASHNPAKDNGIKFFDCEGLKLKQDQELLIEQFIRKSEPKNLNAKGEHLKINEFAAYKAMLSSALSPYSLEGLSIVLDASNGATHATSPAILRALGAQVDVLGNDPLGVNINKDCGSEHPELMGKRVTQLNANIGLAHDGDGDRVIISDKTGSVLNGDEVLGILALGLKKQGLLKQDTLVATIQSNEGLALSLAKHDIKMLRVSVGDRHVLHKLIEIDASLGGESSGHVILKDHHSAGDGLLCALALMGLMLREGASLSELRKSIQLLPQLTANMPVSRKTPLGELSLLPKAIASCEDLLKGRGRVLVRYSGTEPKIRLLVEGEPASLLEQCLSKLKDAVRLELQTN